MSVSTIETHPAATAPESKPRLKPRRTLNRLALAVFALLVALAGQYFFNQQSVWDGAFFFVVAAVLFVRAVGPQIYPHYKLTPVKFARLNTAAWRRNLGLWLILMALGVSGLGYTFFGRDDVRLQAWWLYVASIGLFLAAGLLMTPGRPVVAELRRLVPNRNVAIALAVIVGAALFMRLYHFTQQPFGIWFDEAEAGLQARQMLQTESYRPIFFAPINVTGHFLALYALALAWLGNTIYSMRLVSVLFGLGGVLAAYLFGNELRGPRFGLALAFFTAVARWDVNFSRIAMTGIDAPFFEFLTLYFFTRLLRRGHLRDAMWAGLALGVGLNFYTAFRLYLLAVALFAIVAIIRWWKPLLSSLNQGGWRHHLSALALLLIASWLLVMPLAKYAVDNPEDFLYRTRQISILTKRDQADLSQALLETSRKHLLMFNVAGDKNGRHNLPGQPMLDPLMGTLMLLGIALALARTRHPANLFFLILIPTALLGGILSVDFEAPQSLRSIAVLPAVIYFCGLSVAALGREAEDSLAPLPRPWILGPAVVAAAVILASNAYTYFVLQANDFASWNAFSAPETITGRKMAELGPGYTYYLSPFLTNHPSTRFLAPEIVNQHSLNMPDALPIRDPSGRPVALFIHPDEQWVFDEARRMYPNARFEVLRGPAPAGEEEGPPSVYMAVLQPDDLLAVRGLDLRYLPASDNSDPATQVLAPLKTSRAYSINITWPQESPVDSDFVAEWNGVLYAPNYGPYRLRLVAPAQSLLEIDGNVVLQGRDEQKTTLTLAQGNHSIRITADSGAGQVALYWQPPGQAEQLVPSWALYSRPVTNHGLLGTFYANDNWAGQPALQRIDPFLDTYFHLIPLKRPYTVEWTGVLVAPQSGVYRLGLRAVQEAELFLDGESLIRTSAPDVRTEAAITLEAGRHDVRVKFRDTVDRSRIHLTWMPPNGRFEAIPSQYLWPPMGSYPVSAAPPPDTLDTTKPLTLTLVASLGLPGTAPGQFLEPRDVTVLSNGNVVVADTGNRRVQIFSPDFVFQKELTGDEFPFEEPLAVGVRRGEGGDEILVLDSTLQWIYRYDTDGHLIGRFGGPDARLFHPRGLTVFGENSIGVADTGTSRLVLFAGNGQLKGAIGSTSGDAPGQFNEPTDAIRDDAGTYFVAEAENNRIQRLDIAGNPLNQWNILPAYAYNGPHLAFGPDGSILMTESQSQGVYRYNRDGLLVDQWHTVGPATLGQPVGIYFDPATSRLYVTDVARHQVYVFAVTVEE